MGKGGDTTTQSTSGDLPEYLKPYTTDLLSRAQGVSNQAYTPYQNQRLTDFSPDTTTSFDMIRNQASAGTPGLDAAAATAGGIAGYNASPITSTDVGYTGIPGADLSAYTNPYTQNVLDVQKNRATRAFGEQQAGRDAGAVQAGAFGGDRRFVQDSLANRDLNEQMQAMDVTGLESAYNNATNLFQSDQSRRLQTEAGNADRRLSAATSSEDARRQGSNLGLNAAIAQGGLAQQQQDSKLGLAEALSGVGSKIQQRSQSELDLAYQDFTNQRDYPAKQLQLYSQLLSGTPVTPSSTSSTTQPAPDFLSQLAGLATSGAGLWDLLA